MAKSWRLTPQEFRLQPVDDQALMMAYENFTNIREAYRQEMLEEKRTRKGRGENDYEAMRRKMGIK